MSDEEMRPDAEAAMRVFLATIGSPPGRAWNAVADAVKDAVALPLLARIAELETQQAMASVVQEVLRELARAQEKFGPYRGPHEGYAVLLEEVDELWAEVKGDRSGMRAEAVQVAAVALRFLIDVCGAEAASPAAPAAAPSAEPTEEQPPVASCLICGHERTLAVWTTRTTSGVCLDCRAAATAPVAGELAALRSVVDAIRRWDTDGRVGQWSVVRSALARLDGLLARGGTPDAAAEPTEAEVDAGAKAVYDARWAHFGRSYHDAFADQSRSVQDIYRDEFRAAYRHLRPARTADAPAPASDKATATVSGQRQGLRIAAGLVRRLLEKGALSERIGDDDGEPYAPDVSDPASDPSRLEQEIDDYAFAVAEKALQCALGDIEDAEGAPHPGRPDAAAPADPRDGEIARLRGLLREAQAHDEVFARRIAAALAEGGAS